VSECIFGYIGFDVEFSAVDSIMELESMSIEGLHCHDHVDLTSYLEYIHKSITGLCITNGEPLQITIRGRPKLFRVYCSPDCGFVSANSKVSLLNDDKLSQEPKKASGFKQIGGLESVIGELVATLKKPLIDFEKYNRFGLAPPKGILLYGPPGTGKTLLAKAISEELPTTFMRAVKATDLCGPDSDSKIHELFSTVKRKCSEVGRKSILIFIDEIDSLCPRRDVGVTESERRAVAALLTEMDGFDAKTQDYVPIAIIGATNRPNAIDIALRRPGRFEREIEIPPPDMMGRKDILRIFSLTRFSRIWAPTEQNLQELASLTHGFVGADLLSLLSQAGFKAVEMGLDRLAHEVLLDQLVHVKPSALRELAITVPKTNWTDIGGYDDVKSQLIEAVIWPTKYADDFTRLCVSPPKGVLLYGPPGCSKTMMARAVATESSMNFIAIKGPEIFSKWVGESEQAIRDIFRKARQASPCVVFFDEIDAIATQRGSGDSGVSNRVLTQLLTEMDGVSSLKQVVVIAATNRPHVLDPALLRPGRLDRIVYVGLPDPGARYSIWSNNLSKLPHSIEEADFIQKLVEKTEGYSGAEIIMAIKEAAIMCIKESIQGECDLADHLNKLTIDSNQGHSVSWNQLERSLEQVKPRTDLNLLDLLIEFKNRTFLD
jgi:transitional endoplasmic reticulum ATPase